jgi:uncharacterized protein
MRQFSKTGGVASALHSPQIDFAAMTSPTSRCTHFLYLHGFRSSPGSAKALRMARWVAENRPDLIFICPQLPPSPAEAVALVSDLTQNWPRETSAIMGSSLGGFYATVMAERLGCRAALLNPAVNPARDLAKYIGDQTFWHKPEEHFYFRAEYVDELKAITPGALTNPERYFAVIAKGDELLDWREMLGRYQEGNVRLLEGSDHALSDFEDHLPFLIQFLNLSTP